MPIIPGRQGSQKWAIVYIEAERQHPSGDYLVTEYKGASLLQSGWQAGSFNHARDAVEEDSRARALRPGRGPNVGTARC